MHIFWRSTKLLISWGIFEGKSIQKLQVKMPSLTGFNSMLCSVIHTKILYNMAGKPLVFQMQHQKYQDVLLHLVSFCRVQVSILSWLLWPTILSTEIVTSYWQRTFKEVLHFPSWCWLQLPAGRGTDYFKTTLLYLRWVLQIQGLNGLHSVTSSLKLISVTQYDQIYVNYFSDIGYAQSWTQL